MFFEKVFFVVFFEGFGDHPGAESPHLGGGKMWVLPLPRKAEAPHLGGGKMWGFPRARTQPLGTQLPKT